MEVTLQEQIDCIDRELGMRARTYPCWVQEHKLLKTTADLEMERMKAVRATLVGLKDKATA